MLTEIDVYSLILLSIGLAMDAFSVATATGFGLGKIRLSDAARMSFCFGLAHVLMPISGWLIGRTIVDLISQIDHWIAFSLLLFVGGRMIKDAFDDGCEVDSAAVFRFSSLILFTVAVSIDALAVGLSFSLQRISIVLPSLFMGAGTLVFTFTGLMIGSRTGQALGKSSQIIGGLILIYIGVRVVLTHLF